MLNPYQAPQALPDPSADFPATQGKRPIAVGALMLIFVVFIGLGGWYIIGAARLLYILAANSVNTSDYLPLLIGVGWRLFLMAAAVLGLVSTWRGRRWSRWIGVLFVAVFVLALLITTDTHDYGSEAGKAGGYIGRNIIFPALMAWWAYRFGFSSKARRYFTS